MKNNIIIDELNINNFRIKQNKKLFCFGTDAVMLAHFTKIHRGEKVLDIGTGNGIIPVLLCAARTELDFNVTGIEIQEDSFTLALDNIALNHIENKFKAVYGDINNAKDKLEYGSYNVVVTNPPYMKIGSGYINKTDEFITARHEIKLTLEDLLYQASKLLKSNGRFYMIHRSERLCEVISCMNKNGIEPKVMQFIQGRAELAPDLFLIEGRKAASPGLRVLAPIILRDENNEFTENVEMIYKGSIR